MKNTQAPKVFLHCPSLYGSLSWCHLGVDFTLVSTTLAPRRGGRVGGRRWDGGGGHLFPKLRPPSPFTSVISVLAAICPQPALLSCSAWMVLLFLCPFVSLFPLFPLLLLSWDDTPETKMILLSFPFITLFTELPRQ